MGVLPNLHQVRAYNGNAWPCCNMQAFGGSTCHLMLCCQHSDYIKSLSHLLKCVSLLVAALCGSGSISSIYSAGGWGSSYFYRGQQAQPQCRLAAAIHGCWLWLQFLLVVLLCQRAVGFFFGMIICELHKPRSWMFVKA